MTADQPLNVLKNIKEFYDSIPSPKFHHANLDKLKEKLEELQCLKADLGDDQEYKKLVNAISQIAAKLERHNSLINKPASEIWSNLSDRGMNKAIPPILERAGQILPVEWKDKYGNTCSISNGYWGAKNYRVMDALGYMFLLKEGGDCRPVDSAPIFNDLVDIQQLESQLNGGQGNILTKRAISFIRFTDKQFRQLTNLNMNSTEIKNLLLETSRVEFKLTFPVRCKSTGARETSHSMNYYSRFFELGYEDLSVKKYAPIKPQ